MSHGTTSEEEFLVRIQAELQQLKACLSKLTLPICKMDLTQC